MIVNMYIFNCKQCSKKVITKDKRNKYCSRECFFKGNTKKRENKCLICKIIIDRCPSKLKKGMYCSKLCADKGRIGKYTGVNSPRWVGDRPCYQTLHMWMRRVWGKASICKKCGSKYRVQWAKKSGKDYCRNRDNFIMLCQICHVKYDFNNNNRQGYSLKNKNL